ncbi:hypothetical protein BOTBODRAFT_37743 [Botryobasidium botryosum FD-172 SS1]|uniref:BTB domain-containing protein n=1 Tax=Botryobasidium botryosum (strain FD-172 SS1) TaxID=930990 RepID=A0A067LYT4_BOTB1|nr:hypothetical protein BOTBODRAFT_37743 [Botryobasidium botryosum FD-172 SS1]
MPDTDPPLAEAVQADEGPLRHPELYIAGDFVVLALGPRPILLRVSRAMLTTHSEIFRDMFGLPKSNDGTAGTVEGTTDENPIFLPDDPDAFIYVLKLYHHNMLKPPIQPPSFATALGVLRVSSKYQFQETLKWGRDFLRETWSLKSLIWQGYLNQPRPPPNSPACDAQTQNALELIRVSRETGIKEFISPAFYYLCVSGGAGCASSSSTILSHHDLFALLEGARTLTRSWGTWISQKKCAYVKSVNAQSKIRKAGCTQCQNRSDYGGSCYYCRRIISPELPEITPIPVVEETEWDLFVLSDSTIKSALASMGL